MKRVVVAIFMALFLLTAVVHTSVFADSILSTTYDDKKKNDKKKDAPGPVVVKDKNDKKDQPKEKDNPKKGKKSDQ